MTDDPLAHLNDAQLMARLAAGDRSALAELVYRHQNRVLQIAYRTTGDRALAEDIGQETFLRVWRSSKRYKPTAQFGTWLYRIVVNLCLDALKKRKPLTGEPPEATAADGAAPSSTLDRGEQARRIRQAVAALPHRQRVALVLHRFSGLPQRLVAETTGWSESAVESLLVRAYAALRVSLSDLAKHEDCSQGI